MADILPGQAPIADQNTPSEVPQGAPETSEVSPPTLNAVAASAATPEPAPGPELVEDEGALSPEQIAQLQANEVAFSWQASEYVHHHKGPGWYLALGGVVLVLTVMAVILRYWLQIVAFLVMGAAIIVYARKPPRTLLYELTPTGITIDGRVFSFGEFRSFGVLPDEEWHTIDLEPTKRFNPRVSLLFDDADFESIVGHLELHLPRVDRKPDTIEWITRFLRF